MIHTGSFVCSPMCQFILWLTTIALFNVGVFSRQENFKRIKRWGGYGPPLPQGPYIPNSNIAIGYPTAYGLGNYVRPPLPPYENGYGNGTPNPRGFSIRCSNGGAHLGTCRLDDDAICVALGGTCVNSACCTTPFIGLLTATPKTTTPSIVDGEAMTKPISVSEEESAEEEDEDEKREETASEERRKGDEERKSELLELARLIEIGRTIFYTTPKPMPETSASEVSVHWTVPGLIHSTLSEFHTSPITNPSQIETTTSIPITTTTGVIELPMNSHKVCDSGLKPVGPCDENEECPKKHFCERGKFCCFSYF